MDINSHQVLFFVSYEWIFWRYGNKIMISTYFFRIMWKFVDSGTLAVQKNDLQINEIKMPEKYRQK